MKTKRKQRTLRQTVDHKTRRRLIEALWHSSEPLSARRFFEDYGGGGCSISCIAYHLRVLQTDGIVKPDHADHQNGTAEQFCVLDGPNTGEAVRLIGLSAA